MLQDLSYITVTHIIWWRSAPVQKYRSHCAGSNLLYILYQLRMDLCPRQRVRYGNYDRLLNRWRPLSHLLHSPPLPGAAETTDYFRTRYVTHAVHSLADQLTWILNILQIGKLFTLVCVLCTLLYVLVSFVDATSLPALGHPLCKGENSCIEHSEEQYVLSCSSRLCNS